MLDFYKTKAGKMFFDLNVPQLVVALKDIASALRDKHAYKMQEEYLIGSTLPNGSVVIFKAEAEDGTKYHVGRMMMYTGPSNRGRTIGYYYVYMDESLMTSKSNDGFSFSSLEDAIEAIGQDLY